MALRSFLGTLCFFYFSVSSAQLAAKQIFVPSQKNSSSVIKELKIGDKVPDIEFKMMNYSGPRARISDFKQKIIILDFWATWCTSCIEVFPKIDSFQEIFKDNVQFLLVNSVAKSDEEGKIIKLLERWKRINGEDFPLPIAFNDTWAKQTFPHTVVPHYVWIGADGLVKAITSSSELTRQNIETAIQNSEFSLKRKVDLTYDKPIYLGDNFSLTRHRRYSFFLRGKLDDVSFVFNPRFADAGDGSGLIIRGWSARNCTLLDLYKAAFRFHKDISTFYINNRIILDLESPDEFIYDPVKVSKEDWEKNNLYTYDLVVPEEKVDSLYDYILADINHNSGYRGRYEKRKVVCFVLQDVLQEKLRKKSNTSVVPPASRITLPQLISKFNLSKHIKCPVINESGFDNSLDARLFNDLKDVQSIKTALSLYGINLLEEQRDVNMFVISK